MLDASNCSYFEDESMKKEKGTFEVDKIQAAEISGGKKFRVLTDTRTWDLEADSVEVMVSWVRAFNEHAAPDTSHQGHDIDADIESMKPEEFSGLSVWLELPGLQSLVNQFKGNHVAHIALCYGLEEQNAIQLFNLFSSKLDLCYGHDWNEFTVKRTQFETVESEAMQVGFLDLYFQLTKELSEIYAIASDTFVTNQRYSSIINPRCCIFYAQAQDGNYKESLVEELTETCSEQTTFGFGEVSLWRTDGPPEKWERIAKHEVSL